MLSKRIKTIFLSALTISALTLVGCSSSTKNTESTKANGELPTATISIKDFGDVEVELYPELAPNTVNNFISLANDGFYDGTTFHRVIKDFMIQGGDPEGTGMGGPGYSIKGEFTSNGFENNLAHTEGVLSMARSYLPDSAGSQFFIMTGTSPHLDGEYAAFGKVTNGIDIVHKVENTETDSSDKPINTVTIESIKVDTKGVEYPKPEIIEE